MTPGKKDKTKPANPAQVPPAVGIESPEISSAGTEVPTAGEKPAAGFPVVGIGASAGRLAAFEAFFSGMPAGTDPGMVMAQNPGSTEYDGMPRSAIATGLVDFGLPPAEMPAQLMAYVAHAFGNPPRPAADATPKAENALKKIFILLRTQTGHDFSNYKPSTILRRIERRMAVHQIETMDLYVKFLQLSPIEVEALFRDLLIGVTKFFRDPEAFKSLEEKVLPGLFANKPSGALIRMWSPGCSTGEEAYSLAILLQEQIDAQKKHFKFQVFATDIDSQAIATARAGVYPASIVTDICPERLSRFFTPDPDGGTYLIHKGIRDMLVFSEQDIIKDPPFSKLDLISCRNLLIYMDGNLQKKLIPLFHYALNPGAFLFLGTSETVGDFSDLFGVIDRKSKLYLRKEDYPGGQRTTPGRYLPPVTPLDAPPPPSSARTAAAGKLSLRELTAALHKSARSKEIIHCPGLRVRTNGEIATVNSELQTKVADLSRANNDMNNLLAGTGIGTIFWTTACTSSPTAPLTM